MMMTRISIKSNFDDHGWKRPLGFGARVGGRRRDKPLRLLGNTSPGLWTVRSHAFITTYIQLFRHPGHHHFFIIFPTPFYIDFCSILAPNLVPKSFQNLLKIDPKSVVENYQHFKRILNRIFVDLAPPEP